MAESDRASAHLFEPDHTQHDTETEGARGVQDRFPGGRWRFSNAVEAALHLGSSPR